MKFYTKDQLKSSRIFFDRNPANYLLYLSYFIVLVCISLLIISKFITKTYIVKGTGTIETYNKMYITPLINGNITSIEKPEGSDVEKGDILFKISTGINGIETSELDKQIKKLEKNRNIYDEYEKSLKEKKNYLDNSGEEQTFYGKVEYYLSQVNEDKKYSEKIRVDIKNKENDLAELQTELNEIQTEINSEYTKNYERKVSDLNKAESKLQELVGELETLNAKVNKNGEEKDSTLKSEISAKEIEIEAQNENVVQFRRELEDISDTSESELNDETKIQNEKIKSKNQEISDLKSQTSESSLTTFQQLISELGATRTSNETKIVELESQKNIQGSTDNLTDVITDKGGTVHYLSLIKSGLGVQALQPIAQIIDEKTDELIVEAYISAQDRTKINLKNSVTISVNGVNSAKYGLLRGTVYSISNGTLIQTVNNEQQIFYQVNVLLKDKKLRSGSDEIAIQSSMPVQMNIIYDKETYWEWFLKQLNFK